MAEPNCNQHLTLPATIVKAPEKEDPESLFTHIENPSSSSHAKVHACNGPHPDDLRPSEEEVDPSRHTLQTTHQRLNIMNGLKLRLKGQTPLLAAYTYALFPLMEKRVSVEWKILVTDDVQSQHIRCHQLQDGDDLSMLVSNFKEQHAKAVILINTQDSYSIVPLFLEGMKKSSIPMVVITQSDGANLLASLKTYGDDVQARLDTESDMDTQSPSTARKKSDKEVTGPGVKRRLKEFLVGDKGMTMDLRAQLIKLMFSEENRPVFVSKDRGKFTMVLATLTNYEKQAKEDSHHITVNEALKNIKPHLDELFNEDLPFYLMFAYRVHLRRKVYQCEEMGTFITTCLRKIESLDNKELARILNNFIERGDFQVMAGINEESVSMFRLMECACLELSELSKDVYNRAASVQGQTQGPSYPKFCYIRMMWLSMALKFHCHRRTRTLPEVSRTTPRYWSDRFIKYQHRIILTDDVLKDLVDGLVFGRRLYLPKELQFNIHHMTDLVVSERCIRPFRHLELFLNSLEQFLMEEEMFCILTQIRAKYTFRMKEPGFSLAEISIQGTLTMADTITEGLNFLDFLLVLWEKRTFSDKFIDSECTSWLQLLLGLVDITRDHSHTLLRKFLEETVVCKKYKELIIEQILETTHENFSKLNIQRFFTLYYAFGIWPSKFLDEYLESYKLPQGTKIDDDTCKQFFGMVERFPPAHKHNYVLAFLIKIAQCYCEDGCARNFVLDLVKLRVPKLLKVPDQGSSYKADIDQAKEVQKNFIMILINYIHGNALKQNILQQMTKIWDAISDERDEFQQLILRVLYQEVIPEFKVLQDLESNPGTTSRSFKDIIKHSIDYLCKSLSWLQALTAKQTFCWGLVASSSSRVPVTAKNFEWLHNYSYVISELGKLFKTYCTEKKLSENQSVIVNILPDDIATSRCEDVIRYFEWISSIQNIFQKWKRKFESQDVNYDEIMMYASCHIEIERLCQTLCSTALIMDLQMIQTAKKTFLNDFELLNVYLLRYIPQHPGAKWCSFLDILREYGVTLPQHLLTPIETYVVFPDDKSRSKDELLKQPVPAGTNRHFLPGSNELSLRLTNKFTLKELSDLVHGIGEFQETLIEHMDMLIFFQLNHSVMFDNYLRVEIAKVFDLEAEQAQQQSVFEPRSLPVFNFSTMFLSSAKPKKKKEGVSVDVLQKSLQNTKQLLMNIIRGEAVYADIIAQGKLDLETLDIENEFTTLKSYFLTTLNITQSDSEGLAGVRSLLELFQYTKHIQKIQDACEQYHLNGCLLDEKLEEVKSLVRDVESEGNRSKLTPIDASERMERIKTILCLAPDPNSKVKARDNCLEVFPAVANSAEFYQFIRDKQFYGQKGVGTFHQQYQLITAQLQHEEYDECVLNHLLAAFNVMTPFLDQKQSFKELMTKVARLDTTIGLKQLETVNGNITLIRLWFSRAEGDTLQNVAEELDKVLETGYFSFKLSTDGVAQMILEYVPSTSQTSNTFEEGVDGGTTVRSRASSSLTPKLEPRSSYSEWVVSKRKKTEQWNPEQIGDFVRKLGFMDTEREGGEKIKHFRHISSIAYRLLELYGQLKDLGNPLYFKGTVEPLFCGIDRTNADARVRETEVNLESWKKRVTELRIEYVWLLFFSIPKILRLYKLVSVCEERDEQLDEIVAEMSFLCKNDEATRQTLKQRVKRELINCQKDFQNKESPMHTIGKFLGVLFREHPLPKRSDSAPLSHDFTQLLHYCPRYSQSQLIQTIIGICSGSGVPEAFEVFRCRPSTTEEELTLFLKRAARHSLRSIVLEVNKLPFKLQESLMQLHLLVQTTQGQENNPEEEKPFAAARASPFIHFIETEPSVLRDVPWIQLREHKEPSVKFEEAEKVCKSRVLLPKDFTCIQLVVGAAGDGKTHYIKEKLSASKAQLTIAVNEAFTPLKAITKLCSLPTNVWRAAIFFNFTMLSPGVSVDESECEWYNQLMEVIGWFFFDLLILGYVEDPVTGRSFRVPGGLQWSMYIEVPSREKNVSLGEALKQFREEVPTLALLGKEHFVLSEEPYSVDTDVQLVCKYLQAYERHDIDRLHRDGGGLIKFSQDPDIHLDQCQQLLHKYMPEHIRSTKITQRLFVKYMKRRCEFLDSLPAFNFNNGVGEYLVNEHGHKVTTITHKLGSTLMRTMLKEVSDFCDPQIKDNWSMEPHQQLIYDYKDCGSSFGLISLHPEKLPESEKEAFRKIGTKIPSMADLFSRDILDGLLSRALNIQLENNRLVAIDDSAYVLTLDYTIKMLNIHERYECGVPVIIEGETGVGKTALIEMLSKLWNQSLLLEWKKQRDRVVEFFVRTIGEISVGASENYQACVQIVQSMSAGQHVSEDELIVLCELCDGTRGQLFVVAQSHLDPMRNDPVVAQLTLKGTQHKGKLSLEQLFLEADEQNTPEATAMLLHAVLCARIKSTYHKINVHAAMTPSDIQEHFKPVFDQARELSDAYEKSKERAYKKDSVDDTDSVDTGKKWWKSKATRAPALAEGHNGGEKFPYRMPFVTVFLDEVNTSSCVGLFKEIIVDRAFDGEPIPNNVFIVAACNPHRGNSMASLGVEGGSEKDKDKWVRGTYYVHKLHPTLRFLMWDYGSLDEQQEKEYINTKMKMLNKDMSNPEVASLTELIVGSQNRMRQYAFEQIRASMRGAIESVEYFARISSRSCVSQREIQRVFTFYQWFMKTYNKLKLHDRPKPYICLNCSRRAILVAMGIVYYMRLNNRYRQEYSHFLDSEYRLPNEVTFTRAFEEELDFYIRLVELPKGIARTRALKENIFATIVCTATHTPLIIVGAPGSSKTLSFNQTIANLKGAESRQKIFRDTTIFHSLDPYFYQCSRRTTSNEIQTVFSRAINRQRSHSQFNLPIYCVVFMDEAGLPEESHESLKVLHYHLDKQEVSFVAITNHVLDAAKTNRAVSLFRPEATNDDLETLAKGCFCSNPNQPPPELEVDLQKVVKLCFPYSTLMEDKGFARFYGLRDFIQFVNYLRRKRDSSQSISPQIVMQALERNFNGSENVDIIYGKFLENNLAKVKRRGILEILRASLVDRPQEKQDFSENEVRYKLIIDPSEDDSLVRLLFTFGILKRDNTRIFVCSNFPADGQLQKINTIAAIRHSAIEGHTVVMSQTDDIHESFYDLFNQRFRRIDDLNKGPRYYTNIAIGAHFRPSRVHPNFQCVVVVKKSEIVNTPAPFLNRFEKYLITHETMLEEALNLMPPSIASIIRAAMKKVQEFIELVSGSDSLYGLCPDTLNSLVLSLLPAIEHTYPEVEKLNLVDKSRDIRFYILQEIVQALRDCTGLFVPKFSIDEFELDVDAVFELVLQDPKFKGLMQDMTHNTASLAIPEAMNVLHKAVAPDRGEHLDVTPEVCLVIALLQQWLVRFLTKRLMQMMTSEALILHRNKIPFSYLKNYLNFHTHFSLLNLVDSYHQALESTRQDPLTCRSATKVLCYTRSSPLIHQLPAEFPCPSLGDKMEARARDVLKEFVFKKTNKLVMHKLSSILSQTTIQDFISNFLGSETAEVCLLVVNMHETTKEIVNHVRIMIEEAETLSTRQTTKMFVMLLYFPLSQFYQPCYPTLFLKGWDHYYLDTIAHSTVQGVVDIRDWFWQCCFPNQSSQQEKDTLLKVLLIILPQSISVLTARVFFGSRQNSSFNSTMSGLKRSEALNELLMLKKGRNGITVGRILCEKFRAYWKPGVMAEHLEKAAIFSKNRESTLNITESIQTNFRSLFLDFLVYMVSRMNENYNIDIIFNSDCPVAVQDVFLEVLRVFPTPKLSKVSLLSNSLPQLKPLVYTPTFPFFRIVYDIMEKVVEQSREEANVKLDILSDTTTHPDSSLDILGTLRQAISKRIAEKMEGSTSKQVLAKAISNNVELWNRYFNDFVLHKLRLDSEDSAGGIAQQMLYTFMSQLHNLEALEKVSTLHAYLHVYQLDLAKLASILRPLNKLHKLHKDTPIQSTIFTPSTPVFPPPKLLSIVEQNQVLFTIGSPEHLATFVVNSLFDSLAGFLYTKEKSQIDVNDSMRIWHNVYRDVMTLPNLKQYIYSALGVGGTEIEEVEGRLNIMQTTFLTLQISPDLSQDEETVIKGQDVFCALFSRHFDDTMKMRSQCPPRLRAVVHVPLEVTSHTGMYVTPCWSDASRVLLEGLFAHFFSAERGHYHSDDIRWFLELANCQKEWGSGQLQEKHGVLSPDLMPDGVTSMNMFKLYLGKILGECDSRSNSTAESSPLQLYHQHPCSEIGVVLTRLGPPGPFIPKFYKECTFINVKSSTEKQNPCMQQPLAHLYFLTVLEHLMSKQYTPSGLVRMATRINTLCTSQRTGVSDAFKAVLYIELQAVTQVIAQQLALHLYLTKLEKFADLQAIINELNELMNDEITGGGPEGGHGMVVALHLFKLLKSSRKFTYLFMKNYDIVLKGINCLEPFYRQLQAPSVSCAHYLPFMMPGANGEMTSLFNQVLKIMASIHEGRKIEALKNLATKCAHSSRRSSKVAAARHTDRSNTFRMMVWLVAYYKYYCKKIPSKILCDAVGHQDLAPYLKDEGYVRMIQCFLLPELMMIQRKEAPNALREDEVVIDLTPDGRHRPIRRGGNERDPVYELFKPSHPEQQDQSDVDLRHTLANMVAVVIGSPTQSNHLWFHMFAPEQLVNTYMTGFMYNSKISPEGLLYDCGVELTAQGEFGRSDYTKHASRGTYTLHSLYLLLLTNFGAFTMSLLTLPDADARIHGPLISDWQSVRHYCVSQLRTVWQHLRNNLGLSEEERTFFVNQCLMTFHEVVNGPREPLLSPQLLESGELVKDSVKGLFVSSEELDDYERLWHCHVYQPTWNQLQDKFAVYSKFCQNDLFAKLRWLDIHYPHFPSEADFVHRIVSYGELEQHSEGGDLRGLSEFAQGWRRLQAGGLLLPDLVEFYRWLHTELSYLVTHERAATVTIHRVVQLAATRYGGEHIFTLYERVKKGYNDYVELIGGAFGAGVCPALEQRNKIYTIADYMPLLHFLTDVEEEEQGNDWLFTVIADIVNTHNQAIKNLYNIVHSQKQLHLTRLLPEQPAKILPTEVTEKNCIVGTFTSLHGVSSFLQIIRSRYKLPKFKSSDKIIQGPSMSFAPLQSKDEPEFQLKYLEEDLVRLFNAGKPLIESPSSIRTLFKFKQSSSPDVTVPDDVIRATLDLEEIGYRLPDEYKEPLSANLNKRLEYEFHSCGYNNLIEIITALRTICGHLVKVIMEDAHLMNEDKEDLNTLTLPRFMMAYVYEHLSDPQRVLHEIGVTPHSLKHYQLTCLIDIPLPSVFPCLQCFVRWVDNGVYDFCNLPLAIKVHLTEEDVMFFESKLIEKWAGTTKELESAVKKMIEALKHSENDITKTVNSQAARVSIIEYFKNFLLIDEEDKLPPLIPETVVLQHYVHFRLALRKLLIKLRAELTTGADARAQGNLWSEFVADLWNLHLPHLREETYGEGEFVFDLFTNRYGFDDQSDCSSDDELFMHDLENDGYEEVVMEGDSFVEVDESISQSHVTHSYDLAQSTDEEEESDVEDVILSSQPNEEDLALKLLENPEFRKKVMSMEKKKDNEELAPKARTYTPEDVGDFLTSIKLDKYSQAFVENEVGGDLLLEEGDCGFLNALGVNSFLDCVRITTLFRRRLQEAEPRLPVSEVLRFLSDNKLEKYVKLFERHEIDGDMLVETEKGLMKNVMNEIGIGAVDMGKILNRFKTFFSSS